MGSTWQWSHRKFYRLKNSHKAPARNPETHHTTTSLQCRWIPKPEWSHHPRSRPPSQTREQKRTTTLLCHQPRKGLLHPGIPMVQNLQPNNWLEKWKNSRTYRQNGNNSLRNLQASPKMAQTETRGWPPYKQNRKPSMVRSNRSKRARPGGDQSHKHSDWNGSSIRKNPWKRRGQTPRRI